MLLDYYAQFDRLYLIVKINDPSRWFFRVALSQEYPL